MVGVDAGVAISVAGRWVGSGVLALISVVGVGDEAVGENGLHAEIIITKGKTTRKRVIFDFIGYLI